MTRRSTRFFSLASLFTLAFICGPAAHDSADGAPAAKKDVTVTLKIADKTSGLSLEAKKMVTADTNAFDVVRHTVAMTYRTEVGGGPVVSSLCGVNAPRGLVWVATIDGSAPAKGIASVAITIDTLIEWKLEKATE